MMPFEAPEDFHPGVTPEARSAGRPGRWFVFRNNALLVSTSPTQPALPLAVSPAELGLAPLRSLYLGTLGDLPCFAAEVDADVPEPQGWDWQALRPLFGVLDDPSFALAGRALQIVDWDRTHRYCGACGTETVSRSDERSRECRPCGLAVYPRLAPAVMALVRRGRELLLARSPRFPKGMYSALAGFVEPGETLEQCLKREVAEEVSVGVRNLRYFGSQPWPFPHSLMIAFLADYASGEARPDESEIEDVQWFDVDTLPDLPGQLSIARRLIDAAVREIRGA
jgi:NAD+ diphosphatase